MLTTLALTALLLAAPPTGACTEVECPVGFGRFLSEPETAQFILNRLKSNDADARSGFLSALKDLTAREGSRPVTIQLVRFSKTYKSFPDKGFGQGRTPYWLCINCSYSEPIKRDPQAKEYDIWELHGFFILLAVNEKNGSFRVIQTGAAG